MKEIDLKNAKSISLKNLKKLGLEPKFLSDKSNKKRKSKFNAKKTKVDGIIFDSKFESERYAILSIEEKAGLIEGLRLQVKYQLSVNEIHICNYIADFTYIKNGDFIVEDAKGMKTQEYKLKKKLMKAIHDIDILETFKN